MLTPLKKIFTLTVFIASNPFAYMGWQMVKNLRFLTGRPIFEKSEIETLIFTAYLLIIMSPLFKVLKGTMNYRKMWY